MNRFSLPSSQSLSLSLSLSLYIYIYIFIYIFILPFFRSLRYFTHYSGPLDVPKFLFKLLPLDPRYGATGCSERMCSSDSKSCFSVSGATLRETFFRFWSKFRGGTEHTETTKRSSVSCQVLDMFVCWRKGIEEKCEKLGLSSPRQHSRDILGGLSLDNWLQEDGQVRLGQVRLGQVRLGQVSLGQFRLCQVRLGQVRLGQVRLGQVRLGQVRLGQVRLDVRQVNVTMLQLTCKVRYFVNRLCVIK